jgi:hypothetical protein
MARKANVHVRSLRYACATTRRYRVFQPPGNLAFAWSSETAGGMMPSWPGRQFTGVATVCFAVSWQESSNHSTSSKLRPVLIG